MGLHGRIYRGGTGLGRGWMQLQAAGNREYDRFFFSLVDAVRVLRAYKLKGTRWLRLFSGLGSF